MRKTGGQLDPAPASSVIRARRSRQTVAIALLLCAAITTVVVALVRHGVQVTRPRPAAEFVGAADQEQGARVGHRQQDYLGPQACAECHAERVEEFKATRHYQACMLPEPDRMPAGFAAGHGTFQTRVPGLRFEMSHSGDDFLLTSVRETPEGEQRWTSRIDMMYGAGAGTDEVYFTWHGDALFELPIVWMNPGQEWAADEFDPYGDQDYAREVTPQCIGCHSTRVDYVAGTRNQYRRETLIMGVTCERCHGPGRQHVEFHQAHPAERSAAFIVAPAKLSRDRQMDLCGQCHTNTIRYRRAPGTYRPGDVLDAYYRVLVTKRPEEDHVANQVQYLRQSKCYEGSTSLTCTTCHDPHQPKGPPETRSQTCLTCHEPAECGDQPRQPAAVRDNCVGCHMPVGDKIQVFFHTADDRYVPPVKRCEHRIAVYPAARRQVLLDWYRTQSDAASRAEADRLSQELAAYWRGEGDRFRDEYRFLAALDAYRRAWQLAPEADTRTQLEHVKSVQLQIDDGFQEAEHLMHDNRLSEAIATLEGLLELKPDLAMAHGKLGTLYAATGDRKQAVEHLQKMVRYDPDDPYGEAMLGWLEYVDNYPGEALDHLKRADDVEPYNAQIKYEMGLALQKLDRANEAVDVFQKVLEIDPNHAGASQGLGHALAAAGRPQQAVAPALRAAELTDYQNVDVLITLADVYAAADRFPDAETTLRRAIELARRTNPDLVPQLRRRLEDLLKEPAVPQE